MAVARGNGEPENAKVVHARGEVMPLKPRAGTPPGSGKPPPLCRPAAGTKVARQDATAAGTKIARG